MNSTQAAQAFEEAERRFSEHKFDEALQLLENLSRTIPLHESVEFARAQTLVMLDRTREADAICDTLLPLFGAEGVEELKHVLRDMEKAGDEVLQWGFARPTEEPLSFDLLDLEDRPEAPADEKEDIDSFFAELGAADEDESEAIALQAPEPDAEIQPYDPLEVPSWELDEPAAAKSHESATAELGELPRESQESATSELAAVSQEYTLEPLDAPPLDESPGVLEGFLMDPREPNQTASENVLGSLQDDLPTDEHPSDTDDLGPLSSLDDDALPVVRPFENELGALGDLGPLDEGPDEVSSGEFFLLDSSGESLTDSEPDTVEPRKVVPASPSHVHAFEDDDESPEAHEPTWQASATPPPIPPTFSMEEESAALPAFSVFDEAAPPPPPPPPVTPPAKRSGSKRVLVLLLVLAAAGGGGVWFYLQPKPESSNPSASAPSASTPGEPDRPAQTQEQELTASEFTEMLAGLAPDGDPAPLLARLNTVRDVTQWPEEAQPALWLVVQASGTKGGGSASTAYVAIARALMDKGAPPDFASRGVSLVDLAAQQNDEPMIRLLLERGAKATPGMMVWAARGGRLPLIQQVLKSQPDAVTAEALYASIDARQEAVTALYLSEGGDLEEVLRLAVQRGTRHVFRFVVDQGVDVRALTGLIHTAIAAQQPAMVELLLQAGVDPRSTNESGETPRAMLEARTPKSAADQEMLRLLEEHTAVQVAGTSQQQPSPNEPSAPAARELGALFTRSKQQEEWTAAGAWRGPLATSADSVLRIDIDAQSPGDLEPLAELRPGDLHALRLTGPGVTDASLKYVAKLSGLRELDIVGAAISDVGLQELKSLTLLTSLRVTSPPGTPRAQINGPGLTILRPMLHLLHLDFSGTTFGDRALPLLDPLTALKSLNLSGTEVTDASLGTMRHLRNLEVLAFGSGPGLEGKVTGSALYAVRDIQTLRELHLYGVPMSPTAFEVLEGLRRLSYLDLRKSGITDADMPRLVKLKHLGVILLGENELENEAQKKLTAQMGATRLEF